MLITNKANDVVTLKLVSGEEVIGYFVNADANEVTLRKPVVPVPTGEGTMALAPFIMSSDYLKDGKAELGFNKSTVITVVDTSQQFKDVYTKQVSGLDLSQSKTPGLIT